jgi:hypothetical protein
MAELIFPYNFPQTSPEGRSLEGSPLEGSLMHRYGQSNAGDSGVARQRGRGIGPFQKGIGWNLRVCAVSSWWAAYMSVCS